MSLFKKIIFIFSAMIALTAAYIGYHIPPEDQIKGCITTTMFNVDLCPQNKNYVHLKNISTYLQRTLILTEDSRFYTHHGFDSEGIEHCIEKLKEKKRIVCGGSTLSQQLAKNMFLSKNKTFIRKGLEALITIKIEKTLTKKEILEKYLNVVQFGKNIFGIKQAATFYFKKSPSQLDPVESAFLAMILPSPEKYSQSYFRKELTHFARRRISKILEDMYKYKSMDEEQYVTSMAKLESFLQSVRVKEMNDQITNDSILNNEMSDDISNDDVFSDEDFEEPSVSED
jgi:monofunctional biosynthetic peptidoglycan transglycosylase